MGVWDGGPAQILKDLEPGGWIIRIMFWPFALLTSFRGSGGPVTGYGLAG